MPEGTLIPEIKTSQNPDTQQKVDSVATQITARPQNQDRDAAEINREARTKVANQIWIDRIKQRMGIQLKKTEDRATAAEELSTQDPLTGLLNRRGFQEMYSHEIARINRSIEAATRGNHPLRKEDKAVAVVLDLNNFKDVNERYHHEGGDAVLKQLAQIMREHTRESDLLCRPGGDEFTMVLSGNDLESARKYMDEIFLPAIAANEFVDERYADNQLRISAGVCEIDPQSPEGSLALADEIQDMAKQKSRDLSGATQVVYSET